MSKSLLEILQSIEDPRHAKNRRYSLDEILFLCVCAVVSGAEGWSAIAQFGEAKLAWLRRFLAYENGIPNEDTIAWVIGRLRVKEFEKHFVQWMRGITPEPDGEIISIDGKTARRSHDRRKNKSPLHMVSAWAGKQGVSLGQVATAEKSNEITAIPVLLDLLELKGALITIDAMGCQTAITQRIIAKKADYVLALKGNQGLTHDAVIDYFEAAEKVNFAHVPVTIKTTLDEGHGRIETRMYYLARDINTLPKAEVWSGLSRIGMVLSHRKDKATGKQTSERRYYLSSVTEVELFAEAVRAHWGVENQLHWVLDMVFREDESRIRSGDTPAIFNIFRQFANNVLRKMDSTLSIKARRFQAAMDDDFRAKVLLCGT